MLIMKSFVYNRLGKCIWAIAIQLRTQSEVVLRQVVLRQVVLRQVVLRQVVLRPSICSVCLVEESFCIVNMRQQIWTYSGKL